MKRLAALALATAVGVLCGTAGCGGYDPNEVTVLYQPDYEQFKTLIHPLINNTCGTLDCHGQVGRPLRIYGTRGLRLFDKDARLVPGGAPTVEEEYRASFESFIGLEPEATRRVVACDQAPDTLLVLRKPSGLSPFDGTNLSATGERHKGGNVMVANSKAYNCVRNWLQAGCEAFDERDLDECRDAIAEQL